MDTPVATPTSDPPRISMKALLGRQSMQILAISRMATMLGIATLSYGAMVYLAQEGRSQFVISLFGMTRYAAALLFGTVIVLAVIFMPRGLWDLARGFRQDGLRYFLQNIRANRL